MKWHYLQAYFLQFAVRQRQLEAPVVELAAALLRLAQEGALALLQLLALQQRRLQLGAQPLDRLGLGAALVRQALALGRLLLERKICVRWNLRWIST